MTGLGNKPPVVVWREFDFFEPRLSETVEHYIYQTSFGTYRISKTELKFDFTDRYGNYLAQGCFPWLWRQVRKKWQAIPLDLITAIKLITLTENVFEIELTLSENGVIIAKPRFKIEFAKETAPKVSFYLNPTDEWKWDFQWSWVIIPTESYCFWKKTMREAQDITKYKKPRKSERKKDLTLLGQFQSIELGDSENPRRWRQWLLSAWKTIRETYAGSDPVYNKASVIVFYEANQLNVDPVVVGTTGVSGAVAWTRQRKSFMAYGRIWLFWSNGVDMVCSSSVDGISWLTPFVVRSGVLGGEFSIAFDGKYFHYCFSSGELNTPLYYRRGFPNPDGSITWSADEQIAEPALEGYAWRDPDIAVDSDGYPWIIYEEANAYHYPVVTKSARNDGTWETQTGFPFYLDTYRVLAAVYTSIISLTGGKVYCFWYFTTTEEFLGRLWDGTAWGAIEVVQPEDYGAWTWSAVNVGDDIYVTWLKFKAIWIRKRTYGVGWETKVGLYTQVTLLFHPVIATWNSNLYVIFVDGDNVYYRMFYDNKWYPKTLWFTDTDIREQYNCIPNTGHQIALLDVDGFIETKIGWTRVGTLPWLNAPNDGNYIYEDGSFDVDGFVETKTGWTRVGVEPWLNAPNDGNYIYTAVRDDMIGDFTFQDVPAWTVGASVYLSVYCRQDAGGDDIIEVYLWNGEFWFFIASLTPNPDGYTYQRMDVSPHLDSQTKINSAMVYFKKITVAKAETVYIDHVKLETSSQIGDFTFENAPTDWLEGSKVFLWIYAKQNAGGDDLLGVSLWDGTVWTDLGTFKPNPDSYKYIFIDVSAQLNTKTKIDEAQVCFRNVPVGSADTIEIDHARLSTLIQPEFLSFVYVRGVASPYEVKHEHLTPAVPVVIIPRTVGDSLTWIQQ